MLPLRSYWPALLLLSQEAYCPHRPVDPASLVDWRFSGLALLLLEFRVDTISKLRNQLYCTGTVVPTDGRQLMMLFSTGTGLERMEVVGPDQDCWRGELEDAGSSGLWQGCCNVTDGLRVVGTSLQKPGRRGGRQGFRPWQLRC